MLRLTPPIMNSLYSLSSIRYIYSPILKSLELSISDFGSFSMFDILGMLNWGRGSPKLRSSSSRSAIEMLRSISVVSAYF